LASLALPSGALALSSDAGGQAKDNRLQRRSVQSQEKKPGASDHEIAEAFMRAAAMSAHAGVRLQHGGPFGAAVVRDGVLISCAHNMVLHRGDPCCHAEMNAIQQACQALGSHDLSECDLYTTCEPCPMCWGAVQWSRLGKAYIGVDRHTAASTVSTTKSFTTRLIPKQGTTASAGQATFQIPLITRRQGQKER